LSVLYVQGNLIEQNILTQTSFLGDSDQLALAQNAAQALAAQSAVHLQTGGNLMVNAATIIDLGLASQITVAGQTYSDALIHQAGFLGEESMPAGLQAFAGPASSLGGELAPAAVAYFTGDLAEGARHAQSPSLPTSETWGEMLA